MKKPKLPDKKREDKKLDVEGLLKEKADVESMISYLEDDYRKATVSEKSYAELKQKHLKRLEEINQSLESKGFEVKNNKKEEVEEEDEEEEEQEKEVKPKEEPEKTSEEKKEEKPKIGLLKKLFGKKEEKTEEKTEEEKTAEEGPVFIDPLKPPPEEHRKPVEATIPAEGGEPGMGGVEIEKLKVMIDAIREAKQGTDETIRTLSESIGEVRSMVFQADAGLRESMLKMEKIEDDLSEIKPQEIVKKFRETNDLVERHQMTLEKLDKKSEDLAEKINKVHEMLKSIGNVENLAGISKDVEEKLEDIKEAVKYIERIGSKTEKIFIDLSKGLDDLAVYKAIQSDFDDSMKEIIKTIDGLNVKFESYVSKKDLDAFKEDVFVIKKQIEEINKILPMLQINFPESMITLRKDKEDILMFLDSVEEQLRAGKLIRSEYEKIKESNKKKLKEIDEQLDREWKILEKVLKPTEKQEPVEEEYAKKEVPIEEAEKEPVPEKPQEDEVKEIVEKPAPKKPQEVEVKKVVEKPSPEKKELPEVKSVKAEVEVKAIEEALPETKVEVKVVEEKPPETKVQKPIEEKKKVVEKPAEKKALDKRIEALKKKYEKNRKIVRKSKEEILDELKKMKV
ncbi:MAG TPA: hypothetical protein VJ343_02860 [archaeon]|nr:hypothetical protein [archaeon]